jgi:hypothetical protein
MRKRSVIGWRTESGFKLDAKRASGRGIFFLLEAARIVTIRYGFTPHQDAAATPIDPGGLVRDFAGGCEQMKIQL